ncbi:MAG: FKBP-type peptidyl-prolyl cis-trans isomerase [Bacteroidia bacterium]
MKIYFIKNSWLALFIAGIFFIACSGNNEKNNSDESTHQAAKLKEDLISANRTFNKNQLQNIDEYIQRHNLQADTTLSGLRVKIKKTGKGRIAEKNNYVVINYKLTLLDGTQCYNSDSIGPWKFSLSFDDVPNGLREAVSMMRVGDRALAIMPAYLAYGITGDGNKVPPNAALVYEIQLLKIE